MKTTDLILPTYNAADFVDRDMSWMYFNTRILQEARREEVPALERLSFLGIYSNNLDEFFRVRMATLSRLAEMKGKNVAAQAGAAAKLFGRISGFEDSCSQEYGRAVKEVTAALDAEGIRIVDEKSLTPEQEHAVRCIFRKKISGFISPVWLNQLREFDRANDSTIHLAVEMNGQQRPTDYAMIQLPTSLTGRFFTLPDAEGKKCIIYLDDVVRFCLPMIFPGMGYDEFKAYSFKFTKDAEMEIDHDLHVGPLQKIAKAVKSRKKGAALRVIYDEMMPRPLLEKIMGKLKIDRLDTVKPSGRYHNHKDLMSFPDCGRKDLKYEPWYPIVLPELKKSDSLIQLVRQRDRFVHVPYQSFDYVVRLLQEAAVSKNVKSIKMSLYRVAKNSKIVEALINAARNGKKVTAMVELLARFDESSNIDVSKRMQEAGVNVIFGVEGLKVHSKIVHIGMKRGRDVAIIGTGNFHEGNAKVYTDYFLMTARADLTADVDRVFDFIERPYRQPDFKRLLVSPINMRERFYALIDREIADARAGREAYIKVKINHITDHGMACRLYAAAEAGVKVALLVRGNCSLIPGLQCLHGNMKIRGIIDRYLEHSRIFIFHAGGEDKTFIGSADWMPRNLDNRVEVVTPIEDKDMKADLMRTVEYGLKDNCQARIVDGHGLNHIAEDNQPRFRSQEALYTAYSTAER